MSQANLSRLFRLRQLEVERARVALAACLAEEAAATVALQAIEDSNRRDRAAAPELAAIDPRLPVLAACGRNHGRRQSDSARTALSAAQDRSASSRVTLANARTQAEVVKAVIDSRAATAAERAERRVMHELDDVVRFGLGRARRGR